MILKVSRFSRRNKITPIIQFVRFPEGMSQQLAIRLLGNKRNGINIRRATLQMVTQEQVTKTPKVYDMESGQVVRV
jgi:hypothetical protein